MSLAIIYKGKPVIHKLVRRLEPEKEGKDDCRYDLPMCLDEQDGVITRLLLQLRGEAK